MSYMLFSVFQIFRYVQRPFSSLKICFLQMEMRQVITTFLKFMDYVHKKFIQNALRCTLSRNSCSFLCSPGYILDVKLPLSVSTLRPPLGDLLEDLDVGSLMFLETKTVAWAAVGYMCTHPNSKEFGKQSKDHQRLIMSLSPLSLLLYRIICMDDTLDLFGDVFLKSVQQMTIRPRSRRQFGVRVW